LRFAFKNLFRNATALCVHSKLRISWDQCYDFFSPKIVVFCKNATTSLRKKVIITYFYIRMKYLKFIWRIFFSCLFSSFALSVSDKRFSFAKAFPNTNGCPSHFLGVRFDEITSDCICKKYVPLLMKKTHK
jgi:hypothetical protein